MSSDHLLSDLVTATRHPTITALAGASGSLSVYAYTMRMARINVYLPDELAGEAKQAGINISALTQDAVRSALGAARIDQWLDELEALRPTGVTHEDVVASVDAARDELEGVG